MAQLKLSSYCNRSKILPQEADRNLTVLDLGWPQMILKVWFLKMWRQVPWCYLLLRFHYRLNFYFDLTSRSPLFFENWPLQRPLLTFLRIVDLEWSRNCIFWKPDVKRIIFTYDFQNWAPDAPKYDLSMTSDLEILSLRRTQTRVAS